MKHKTEVLFSGQMLIEVVVAIGIIALVLVGVSELMTRSLKVISFQKQKDVAESLLKKIQNDYRTQRDIDPNGFYESVANVVLDPCVVDSLYKCQIFVDKSGDLVTITARAEWIDGGNLLSVSSVQSLVRTVK
jgi:type II secretory pathway pseudopilin PulG